MRSKTFVRFMGFLEAKCKAVLELSTLAISYGLKSRPFKKLTNQEYLEEEIAGIQLVIDKLKSTGAINPEKVDQHYERLSEHFNNDRPVLMMDHFSWWGDKNA